MELARLNRTRSVTGDGEGLVSRGRLLWLAEAADLTGLSVGLGDAFDSLPWRSHRPGWPRHGRRPGNGPGPPVPVRTETTW